MTSLVGVVYLKLKEVGLCGEHIEIYHYITLSTIHFDCIDIPFWLSDRR